MNYMSNSKIAMADDKDKIILSLSVRDHTLNQYHILNKTSTYLCYRLHHQNSSNVFFQAKS